MRVKRTLVSAAFLYLGWATPANAQSVPPPPPPSAQVGSATPAVKVTARLVQVNVIVQDKNGQPVTGLTKDDFTILDQGQRQTIASMSEQLSTVTTTMATAATQSPNFFSNRYEQRTGVAPSVSVILIDSLNMLNNGGQPSRSNMTSARAQVVKFLKQVQPRDRIALYFLSNKIYILKEFTNDSAALLQAMDVIPHLQQDQPNATPSMDFAPATPSSKMMDPGWALDGIARANEDDTTNRVHQTAAALEAIAKHLAGVPGRKNLIWVSGSFPFLIYTKVGIVSFEPQILAAAQALSNADVAIYAIDARGLTLGQPDPQTVNTMTVLADRTGGRIFRNTNDFSAAIRHAIDDSPRVSYMLSYYPNHNQWDGRFREIQSEGESSRSGRSGRAVGISRAARCPGFREKQRRNHGRCRKELPRIRRTGNGCAGRTCRQFRRASNQNSSKN